MQKEQILKLWVDFMLTLVVAEIADIYSCIALTFKLAKQLENTKPEHQKAMAAQIISQFLFKGGQRAKETAKKLTPLTDYLVDNKAKKYKDLLNIISKEEMPQA